MLILQAVVLGAVQGLTEFIPISSSGHLIAIPYLFGWDYMGKTFDVALHLGTLVALVIYYRRDWLCIITGFARHVFRGEPYGKEADDRAGGRLLVPILVACIPAAVVGYLWDEIIETGLSKWYFVAPALIVFGLVMLVAERVGKKRRGIDGMGYADYIVIGCAQALALFPGVSRSGVTISAGMVLGLDRASSARFSFLLSTPIILGAAVMKLKDLFAEGLPAAERVPFVLGFITAALVGYVAISFLMNYLRSRTLDAFVIYRIFLAAFVLAVFALR